MATTKEKSKDNQSSKDHQLLKSAAVNNLQGVVSALEARANINCRDGAGRTALMYATAPGFVGVVRELVKRGANPHLRDVSGERALDWAKRNNDAECVYLLQEAMGGDDDTGDVTAEPLMEFVLEAKLKNRPPVQNLERSNILRGAEENPQAVARDQLKQLLKFRPGSEELAKKSMAAGTMAPAFQGVQKRLAHHMTTDNVRKLLETRPQVKALESRHIVPELTVAPALQATKRTLEHNLARANLYHHLRFRPSFRELQQKGYLHELNETPQYVRRPQKHGQQEAEAAHGERQTAEPVGGMSYQRRSKNFHLTRVLLKAIAGMADAGELTLEQRTRLKRLTVDQDMRALQLAEAFDIDNNYAVFKMSLLRLSHNRAQQEDSAL